MAENKWNEFEFIAAHLAKHGVNLADVLREAARHFYGVRVPPMQPEPEPEPEAEGPAQDEGTE